MTMRPYQQRGIDQLRAAMAAGKRRIMLYAPTGAGKGHLAAEIIRLCKIRGSRVLLTTHRRELVEDLSARLDKFEIDHGIILAGHWRDMPWMPVQVASIPTLARRECPPADVVIVDEAHHSTAGSWERIILAYPNAVVVGLTATPVRMDGKALGTLFEELIVVATPAELVESGNLVPVTGFAFDAPDLRGVKKSAGDYQNAELGVVMSETRLVGNLVDQWRAHASGLRTIVFAVHVEHSRQIVEQFSAAGVSAEHVDGAMPRGERDGVFARFRSGATQVVSNVMLATEGFDLPEIGCVILARPTLSLSLAIQMIGRGRRPVCYGCGRPASPLADTCEHCGSRAIKRALRLHDHAGVVIEHGLPDDDRDWSLEASQPAGRKKQSGEKAPAVRACAKCFALYDPSLEACPACGHTNPRRVRKVSTVEGEAIPLEQVKRFVQASDDRKRFEYQKLVRLAQDKGYKPGWAKYRFQGRYGHMPPREWDVSSPSARFAGGAHV